MNLTGQTLLFDADDTLWENNIYFERAISAFISYLDHRVHTAEEVREHLNLVELQTVKVHGYGLKSFRRSLVKCFDDLASVRLTDETHRQILSFVNMIAEHEMELITGVAETLPILAKRHRLIVVTKGDQQEQTEKLQRSGLVSFFAAVEVLTEKHESSFRELVERHICDPATTWMIGNSPKSDINPALAAGLNAVFVPHDFTWILEHELVDTSLRNTKLIELAGFTELLQYF